MESYGIDGRKDDNGNYLYGIFCRVGKTERWQGIEGGVEEGETFLESCKREANEEAGISYDAPVVELKSMYLLIIFCLIFLLLIILVVPLT